MTLEKESGHFLLYFLWKIIPSSITQDKKGVCKVILQQDFISRDNKGNRLAFFIWVTIKAKSHKRQEVSIKELRSPVAFRAGYSVFYTVQLNTWHSVGLEHCHTQGGNEMKLPQSSPNAFDHTNPWTCSLLQFIFAVHPCRKHLTFWECLQPLSLRT